MFGGSLDRIGGGAGAEPTAPWMQSPGCGLCCLVRAQNIRVWNRLRILAHVLCLGLDALAYDQLRLSNRFGHTEEIRNTGLWLYDASCLNYTIHMRKTTLVIDDALINEAQQALGTKGIKDTIDRALEDAVAREAGRRLIEQLRQMDGLDLDDEEVMRSAWRE